jgi:hypothetical protein
MGNGGTVPLIRRDWLLDYKLTHRTYEAGYDMSEMRSERAKWNFGRYKPDIMHAAQGRV